MLAICVSFRASSLTGSSSGLIPTAHTNPYLFFSLGNCTCNSHIIKYESFLAYFMRILNSCVVYKFQTVKPGCPPTQPHTFWCLIDCYSTRRSSSLVFLQLHTALTWHWVCSTVLLCFNELPDIFAVINCSVLGDRWYNLCSLQWQIVVYNNE